jgi:C-terminal binding-module, SLH-like, of glucodextranase
MRHLALLPLAALFGCASAGPAGEPGRAAPRLVAAFEDARDDANGPGSYEPPGDTQFQAGDFDLRRFAVLVDGDDVLFEVTLGADIRVPQDLYRTSGTPANLSNNLYLQNIDIYIDTDPSSPTGHTACVPGRRVAFAGGRTWKRAVILTPQPGLAQAVTSEALPAAARKMIFPNRLQLRGRTLIARVPADQLGGPPMAAWGYSVHVSGATWERNLRAIDRLTGTVEANAFTMPILSLREAFAFGGAPAGDAFPRVVDVLLPPGRDQGEVLGSYESVSGAWAKVPFVYAQPPGPAPAPLPAPDAATTALPRTPFTVVDVSDTMVTIAGPVKELKPMQLGHVLGARGEPVARLVVVQVLEKGAVASLVPGGGPISAGARITFQAMPGPTMGGPAPVNP